MNWSSVPIPYVKLVKMQFILRKYIDWNVKTGDPQHPILQLWSLAYYNRLVYGDRVFQCANIKSEARYIVLRSYQETKKDDI